MVLKQYSSPIRQKCDNTKCWWSWQHSVVVVGTQSAAATLEKVFDNIKQKWKIYHVLCAPAILFLGKFTRVHRHGQLLTKQLVLAVACKPSKCHLDEEVKKLAYVVVGVWKIWNYRVSQQLKSMNKCLLPQGNLSFILKAFQWIEWSPLRLWRINLLKATGC